MCPAPPTPRRRLSKLARHARNPWSLAFAAFAACIAITASASAQPAGGGSPTRRELELTVGEQTSIPAQGVARYSEGTPGIVQVRLPNDNSQFIIVAMRPGNTSLLLIMDDGSQIQYRITVVREGDRQAPVQSNENIRLDLYFIQISDTYQHRIGLNWFPAAITVNPGVTVTLPTQPGVDAIAANSTVAASPLPRLDMLQATGWARVLRQAALITANGNEATFESGGEVNFQIAGALSTAIHRIPFGTNLTVMPRYDHDTGRVELHVTTEITDLTNDSSGSGLPGRTISHLETAVNLELGQSLVLAGLTSDSEGSSRSGLPGFSQIPILGALFGTHAARHERIRNVLFLVPTVVDTVSAQARSHIGDALRIYEDFSGDTDESYLIDPISPDSRGTRGSQRNDQPSEDAP